MRRFLTLFGIGCPEAGLELPEGVELAVRESAAGRRFVFLLNYPGRAAGNRGLGGAAYRDLLTGRTLAENETVEPYGVLVLEKAGGKIIQSEKE